MSNSTCKIFIIYSWLASLQKLNTKLTSNTLENVICCLHFIKLEFHLNLLTSSSSSTCWHCTLLAPDIAAPKSASLGKVKSPMCCRNLGEESTDQYIKNKVLNHAANSQLIEYSNIQNHHIRHFYLHKYLTIKMKNNRIWELKKHCWNDKRIKDIIQLVLDFSCAV